MSVLSDRIDALCEEHGVTGYRLCKDIGVSPNMMTELRAGRRAGLSAKTADKIASYFGVSVGQLLGTEPPKEPELTAEERDVLDAVRRATPEQRRAILTLLGRYERGTGK